MSIPSYRRKLLDKEISLHEPNLFGIVLDIGGGTRRGEYTKSKYASKYIIVDRNRATKPDIIGDAERLPIKTGLVHSIKCTEVLEYLNSPEQAVSEMYRVLMDTGELMISTPFSIGIHYDNDLVRFTEKKLERLFDKNRFTIAYIGKQGAYFTCLGYMLKQAILNTKSRGRWLLYWTFPLLDLMVKLDDCSFVRHSEFLSSYTTGYFMSVIKLNSMAKILPSRTVHVDSEERPFRAKRS
jgi:SAM-dependent methyltransferase